METNTKYTLEFLLPVANASEMNEQLVALSSQHGGCWAYQNQAFSSLVSFRQFASPSRVPDEYQDAMWRTDARLGYKGKLVAFTAAARTREQNRGLGCQ
jgi:hypothetical protein